MEKKYEMFKEKGTGVLYRIRALRDFGYVKKGDIGGYIKNLFVRIFQTARAIQQKMLIIILTKMFLHICFFVMILI